MEQSDLSILVKWNISPHINKQECNSHQQFQASKHDCELLKGKKKKKEGCVKYVASSGTEPVFREWWWLLF